MPTRKYGSWNDKRGRRGMGNVSNNGSFAQNSGFDGSKNGVSISNKFDVLVGEKGREEEIHKGDREVHFPNAVKRGAISSGQLMEESSLSPVIPRTEIQKDLKDGFNNGGLEEEDVDMPLNFRVLEYVGQGSKLTGKQIEIMEEEIEIREAKWDGRVVQMGDGICTTNSEVEVESDEGDTARFMVLDALTKPIRNHNLESISNSDSPREHEQFAVEQLFGKNMLEGSKEGHSKFVSK